MPFGITEYVPEQATAKYGHIEIITKAETMQQELPAPLVRFISGMIKLFHKERCSAANRRKCCVRNERNFPGRAIVGNQCTLEKQHDKGESCSHIRHIQV